MDDHFLTRRLIETRDTLFAYLLGLTRDRALAEEAFQELAVSVMSEVAKGGVPDDVDAWLRRLARNRAIDMFRRDARFSRHEKLFETFSELAENAWVHQGEAAEYDRSSQIERLRHCLTKLAPKARSLVELRYASGLGLDEVAKKVAWTTKAVKTGLAKARAALRICIERGQGSEA